MNSLGAIADLLDAMPRYSIFPDSDREDARARRPAPAQAGQEDSPERYIKISDGMARDWAEALRKIERGESPRSLAVERR